MRREPKNFYDAYCLIIDQHGNKDRCHIGRFGSRKKAQAQVLKTKSITDGKKAHAEFVIDVSINHPSTGKLRFVQSPSAT